MSTIRPENQTRADQSSESVKPSKQALDYQRSNSFQEDNSIINNKITQEFNNINTSKKSESTNDLIKVNNLNYCFRSPNSIESVNAPSPAGSIEQFDVISTPLSVDETSESYLIENNR
jgi:hypothetical protein